MARGRPSKRAPREATRTTSPAEDAAEVMAEETTTAAAPPVTTPPRSTAPPTSTGLRAGMRVQHKLAKWYGVVVQLAADGDFLHIGQARIEYIVVEKKVQTLKTRWCFPAELETVRTSPRRASTSSSSGDAPPQSDKRDDDDRSGGGVDAQRAYDDLRPEHLEEAMADGAVGKPELADHERARKVAKKIESAKSSGGTSRTWGACGLRKTAETNISLEERVKSFPDQSLMVAQSNTGHVLFCRCCPTAYTAKLIPDHQDARCIRTAQRAAG